MRNATKLFIGLGILFVLIIVGAYFFSKKEYKEANTKEGIKIGAILPLSGEISIIGSSMQKGMELAREDFQNEKIEIIFEDDQSFDNSASLSALKKLIDVDGVQLILNSAVNTIKALTQTLDERNIPGIVVWDSNETIRELGENVYGAGFSTELSGERMAEYAYNDLSVRHLSIISAQDEWSEIISNAFQEKFQTLGGKIDVYEKVTLNEMDFRTALTKIKEQNSEAIYFTIFPQAITNFVKQTKEIGFAGALLGGDNFIDQNIFELKENAEGIYSTQSWIQNEALLQKYKTKYGEETDPISLALVGLGYDAVKHVVEVVKAMEKDNVELKSENINLYLKKIRSDGFTGPIDFSKNNLSQKEEKITVVKDGKFEVVE